MVPLLAAATLAIGLSAVTPAPATRLVLKDGTIYFLKEPPRLWGGKIIFTTIDGKSYSLNESEVDTIGAPPAVTPTPEVTYNPQDSRSLGGIARQQREKKGLSSAIAVPTPSPHRARRAPRPTRTPRPPTAKTPVPTAGKAPPG